MSGVRLAERWLASRKVRVTAALAAASTTPTGRCGSNWRRRWARCRKVRAKRALTADAREARRRSGRRSTPRSAACEAARRPCCERCCRRTRTTPQRDAAITMLAATIVRGAQDAAVQSSFSVAPRRRGRSGSGRRCFAAPRSRCSARRCPDATAGAGPAAGEPAAVRAAAGTARGQRGGPGGAPAFPREAARNAAEPRRTLSAPAAAGAVAGGGRGGGAGALRLNSEPALVGVGSARRRCAASARRRCWRASSGPASPARRRRSTPLTAAEQQRFDAGQEVYRSLCQACHQPDGRGQEKIAPPLLGSADAGAGGGAGANPAQRQGGQGRTDAAARRGADRRADRGGADLHPARVGPTGSPVDAAW